MKIRVTTAFNDRQNGYVTRPVNEVFECSEQRAKELIDGDIPHIVFSESIFRYMNPLQYNFFRVWTDPLL